MTLKPQTLGVALAMLTSLCCTKAWGQDATPAPMPTTSPANIDPAPAAPIPQTPSEAAVGTAPPAPTPEKPCARAKDRNLARKAQAFLASLSCNTALTLDGLLGDTPDPVAARQASGHADLAYTVSQFDGNQINLRFAARLPLPRLEDRLSAFLGRDDDENFIRDRPDAASLDRQLGNPNSNDQFLAGLGVLLNDTENFNSDIRAGVRSFNKPRVFVQWRLRYLALADAKNLVQTRLTPFWTSFDGFGTTVGADYHRTLSRTSVFRLSGVGTISERLEGFDWNVTNGWLKDLGEQRAVGGEVFVRGQTDEPEPLREFGVRASYRWPLMTNVLYARVTPGYSWPRTDPNAERRGSANLLMGLTMPFGPQRQ